MFHWLVCTMMMLLILKVYSIDLHLSYVSGGPTHSGSVNRSSTALRPGSRHCPDGAWQKRWLSDSSREFEELQDRRPGVCDLNDEAGRKRPLRFCALAYQPPDVAISQPDQSRLLAFVTSSSDGEVALHIRPRWEEIVGSCDRSYLGVLFRDFKDRAKSDPELMFRLLSSLAVGPLVTYDAGTDLSEHPEYWTLWASFTKL